MNSKRWNTRRAATGGFTLIEVLLVLTLLAIIMAMVWPNLQRPFVSYRIHAAADMMRTKWCLARIAAMRSGRTYLFRYTPGSDQFRIGPQEETDAMFSANTNTTAAPHEEGTLPEGIHFLDDQAAAIDSSTLGVDQPTDALAGESGGLSAPILFYPDGTTSNAGLLLADERGRTLRLALRGLTGAVTVTDASAEEAR